MMTSWPSRRRSPVVVAGFLAATLGAAPRRLGAQEQRGYKADQLEPAEAGSPFFAVDGAEIRGRRLLAIGVVGMGTYQAVPGDGRSVLRSQVSLHASASLALGDRFRIALAIPVLLRSEGQSTELGGAVQLAPSEAAGLGDLRLTGDMRLAAHRSGAATLAAGTQIFLPTGDRDEFTSDGQPRFAPRALFGGVIGELAYGAKLGAMLRTRDEPWADSRIGSSIFSSLGIAYRSPDGRAMVGPEIVASTVFTGGAALERRTTPVELLFGAHIELASGLRLALGGGMGLTRGYGAPRLRGLLSIEWSGGDASRQLPANRARSAPP